MKNVYLVNVSTMHANSVRLALRDVIATRIEGCCYVGWDYGLTALRDLLRRVLPIGAPFLITPVLEGN